MSVVILLGSINQVKSRRQLRMSLGSRVSRRHGVKKGEAEKPKNRLKRLIDEENKKPQV